MNGQSVKKHASAPSLEGHCKQHQEASCLASARERVWMEPQFLRTMLGWRKYDGIVRRARRLTRKLDSLGRTPIHAGVAASWAALLEMLSSIADHLHPDSPMVNWVLEQKTNRRMYRVYLSDMPVERSKSSEIGRSLRGRISEN